MDADIQTLSDNARAQFIIKSLYTANKTITKSEILTIYKEALGIKRIDENRICNIIDELSENGTILVSGNHYSLPKSGYIATLNIQLFCESAVTVPDLDRDE